MTTHFAKVNGVTIAFRVQGEGPPLVLVMGYRLSSAAWPEGSIEALARLRSRRFTAGDGRPLGGKIPIR
jgi:pimeloyl-ACP methyl ester carboxylesterase